ncbi:outer membrane receptor for ferrienterochelin and colicins [Lewinella aquimaris]|uniref:Outer membrane receptor for ferrienterochelin and colicins n=1 Tax=Neolewinella aquimaris TaxID=1835722 RepID=A0A840E8C6_9BACT|nr:TonB-dependent receptor [Neolewinella aquimaris]MBB4079845.1 outer membrane receptor for ferrienterochelin and colicins [Neolewinella aquimaris]
MKISLLVVALLCLQSLRAQSGTVSGTIRSEEETLPFATAYFPELDLGTTADLNGKFTIAGLPAGLHTLEVRMVGYSVYRRPVEIRAGQDTVLSIELVQHMSALDEVVVTATRTEKRRTDAPVIVSLVNSKQLERAAANTLSDGLSFQPGLRVETDCQTCNYTQLRMNGLQGGYSQILINGRPIFSPLTGLYGMEQIPVNMIERIEVVRGGVSALYGSSAVGGTVNVITRIPVKNDYRLTGTYQSVGGRTADKILAGNATLVNSGGNAGATLFFNKRNRGLYDANGDNFSELPTLKNTSVGSSLFFLPTDNQKLEVSLSHLYEYRYGGEMVDRPAHLTQQSEERTHRVLLGSLDYQINFNDDLNSLILYYGGQRTDRDHYTGIQPDASVELEAFHADPPYGTSEVTTHQGGVQFNNGFPDFLGGKATLTVGAEYVYDDVFDEIGAYDYLIDQTTTNLGVFVQHDWDISPQLALLAGFRVDKHRLVDYPVVSPRLSLLYKLRETTQFRLGWGTGFRAPQAFDTDLHIAFAAGGVSRISLSDDLREERSNSFTGSVNFDRASEHFIVGFTLEGFHTYLRDAFYQFPLGADAFGERFEKRNGAGATVQGFSLEARANFDYVFQVDAGFTVQSSRFDEPVENIAGLPATRDFLRTPNNYGYATLTYTPTQDWSASANLVQTGSMRLAHFGGEGTGQAHDEYFDSPAFTDIGLRLAHTFRTDRGRTGLEVFGGVKNLLNAYQSNFDSGKNRDSNFIYGPGLPRTLYVGVQIKAL